MSAVDPVAPFSLTGREAERLCDDVEARASVDLYLAAPPSMQAWAHEEGGVTLLRLPALPVSYFNRVVGLGNHATATEADLDHIAAAFAGIKDYWIQLSPGARPAELPAMLAARGFAAPARRSWSKFLRGVESPPAVRSQFTIRRATAADAVSVANVVTTAYGMPASAGPWFTALVGRPNWQVWVAEKEGTIVATGSLYVTDRYGWLGIGATLAEHRGGGAQSALLSARIRAAGESGCTLVTTETGDPITDEKNQSFDNIRRAGFERVYSRVNYAAPK